MYSFSHSSLLLFFSITHILSGTRAQGANFSSDYPTCANAKSRLLPVIVQPYCDNAIITVCGTVNATLANSSPLDNYKATGTNRVAGACEVQILFADPRPAFAFDYHKCVQEFESITIDCMLIGVGKWAKKGHQAGVRGVTFDPNYGFQALGPSNPGYLVGPPEYYPNESAEDLTAEVPGNAPEA
ncbi:MAG: hypothetical protein LQ338_001497 [Usnochroma carphineum]|nr:MAG: hypothetical protein LQ338_001497 [Usnochroma carphineum]